VAPGGGRPALFGRITALHGQNITVAVPRGPGRSDTPTTTATVVYSATTTFKVLSVKSATATASSPTALKIGVFVAAQGTQHGHTSDASAVVLGSGPLASTPPRERAAPLSG
jgi:hypothetical protein